MLRFVEEIILLLLRDEDGTFVHVPNWSVDRALAGAVLMDLALENRIDTDLENLVLVDSTPLGDSLLDPTLADIAADEARDPRYWVERVAQRAPELREEALRRLVDSGILEPQDDRFLWVFRSRRYPMVDGKAEREVKLRIMGILFSEEIPDPRDIVHHLPRRRLPHLPRAALQAGAGAGHPPHRAGAQARPHRSGHGPGHPRHRGLDHHRPDRRADALLDTRQRTTTSRDALVDRWLREEQEPFSGWDFSHLHGRMDEGREPWSYVERAA